MTRCFIAIDLPDDVRVAVDNAQARLKQAQVGVKISWTKVENLHLTLQFLGAVDERAVEGIKSALRSAAAPCSPFEVTAYGTGAFPDENRPRVIWIRCDDAEGRLKALAAAVLAAMRPLGFEPEPHEFTAHLTLGRIRAPRPDVALTRALESLKDTAFGAWRVEAIHLFESQLRPEGSRYTKLSSHVLGAQN